MQIVASYCGVCDEKPHGAAFPEKACDWVHTLDEDKHSKSGPIPVTVSLVLQDSN
jgi:hypothetical protein